MKHKIMVFGVVALSLFLQNLAIQEGSASEDITSSLNVENVIGSTTEIFSFSYVLTALPALIFFVVSEILIFPYALCIAPIIYGCLGCFCCIPAPCSCCYRFITGLETMMMLCITPLSLCIMFRIMPLFLRLYKIPTCQRVINGVAVRIGGLLGN